MKDLCGIELKEGQIVTVFWEDIEDERSSGVGNASYSKGNFQCEVKQKGKKLILVRQDTKEELTASDLEIRFDDSYIKVS